MKALARILFGCSAKYDPLLFLLLLIVLRNALGDGHFVSRCGDCWCAAYDPVTNPTNICPDYGEGLLDLGYISEETWRRYESFELTNPPPKLRSDDGSSDCFPFSQAVTDSIASMGANIYPQSARPACVKPESKGPDAVCAFKFASAPNDDEEDVCFGKSYEMITYESREAAESVGADVIHSGPCGVCSSAADLAAETKFQKNGFQESATLCGLKYSTDIASSKFDDLVECFASSEGDIGFSRDCAVLWAHLSASTAYLCALPCAPDATGFIPTNDSPPACEFSECSRCRIDSFQSDFDEHSGRTPQNSGITENIARPCDAFYRVVHDPCPNSTAKLPPTSAPTSGGTTMMTRSRRRTMWGSFALSSPLLHMMTAMTMLVVVRVGGVLL